MCLQPASEGAECLWRWMANCCSDEEGPVSDGHQSSNDAMTALREQTLTQNAAVMLVLVLVLKDSLRTKMQSLSWSLSLKVCSLSLALKVKSLLTSLESSHLLASMSATRHSSFARYGRAVPCRQRNTSTASLNSIRSRTGNQWRSWSSGVMCSYFRPFSYRPIRLQEQSGHYVVGNVYLSCLMHDTLIRCRNNITALFEFIIWPHRPRQHITLFPKEAKKIWNNIMTSDVQNTPKKYFENTK